VSELYAQFKAAVVQAAPVFLDISGGVEKTCALINDAAMQGVELIVFPELWLPGYPMWLWFDAPIMGKVRHAIYYENSMTVGDINFQKICDTAAANNIHVVLGFSEIAGGSLYISQAVIGREGYLQSCRRKLKPTLPERMLFGEGDGSGLQLTDLDIGKLGALNCWEHIQPLSKYALFSAGEQIHAASWPSFASPPGAPYQFSPEMSTAVNQVYALEGQCFVLMAVPVVDKCMVDILVDTEEKSVFFQEGGGFGNIFGPDGRSLIATLPETEEGLLIADIDLSQIVSAKWLADPVGHYARPDVTRLLLNRGPAPVVESMELPGISNMLENRQPEEGEDDAKPGHSE